MKKNKYKKTDDELINLNTERLKKKVLEETDPGCREAVEDFLDKYKNDTLTGL
jgi:hypothetical protein